MWVETTNSRQSTTNDCESVHSKFISFLYSSYPNIYEFLSVLKQSQTDSYTKMTTQSVVPIKQWS